MQASGWAGDKSPHIEESAQDVTLKRVPEEPGLESLRGRNSAVLLSYLGPTLVGCLFRPQFPHLCEEVMLGPPYSPKVTSEPSPSHTDNPWGQEAPAPASAQHMLSTLIPSFCCVPGCRAHSDPEKNCSINFFPSAALHTAPTLTFVLPTRWPPLCRHLILEEPGGPARVKGRRAGALMSWS